MIRNMAIPALVSCFPDFWDEGEVDASSVPPMMQSAKAMVAGSCMIWMSLLRRELAVAFLVRRPKMRERDARSWNMLEFPDGI